MTEPRDLSVFHAAELMRRGNLTAEALVLSCLERIEQRQSEIRAWVTVDAETALETARTMDQEAAQQRWRGPLHGIPVGIKDIIDIKGMETGAGCDIQEPWEADTDAACVNGLREAGAVFLGKTVTTPFAFRDPAETRNPWNTEHTPGGSSSGSGAAVADRMCLAAVGTQTAGSVLRPAAFNGVVGFKAGYGKISLEGVIPLSWQMDHVGTLSRNVEDAHLLWHAMRVVRTLDWQSTREKMAPALLPRAPRTVWRVRDFFETESSPECQKNLDEVCDLLARHGVRIVENSLPASFADISGVYQSILYAEAAAYHRDKYAEKKHLYPHYLGKMVEEGLGASALDYIESRRRRAVLREEISAMLGEVDAAIMSCTPTPAPDMSTTGDPQFNMPWSLCGLPALSLPSGLTAGRLPLAVQLVCGMEKEEELLSIGGWCESLLSFNHSPR